MAWFKRYPTVIRRSVNRSFVRKLFLLAAIVTGNEFCGVIAQAQEVSVLSSIREPFAQEAEQNSIPEKSTPLLSSPVTPSAASRFSRLNIWLILRQTISRPHLILLTR